VDFEPQRPVAIMAERHPRRSRTMHKRSVHRLTRRVVNASQAVHYLRLRHIRHSTLRHQLVTLTHTVQTPVGTRIGVFVGELELGKATVMGG
jgi:hypothetical protein